MTTQRESYLSGRSSLLHLPRVEGRPEADAGLHPEVGSLQHLLPQGHLLPHRVHPAAGAAAVFSW